jgi:hypothetical protein
MMGQAASNEAGRLRALNSRGNTIRDSINSVPIHADMACAMGFFADPTNPARSLSIDQFETSWQKACRGRLFFRIPEKIQTGQHSLLVQADNSMLQVPFRILTKEEEKSFSTNWKDLKKEHEAEHKKQAQEKK